MPQAPALTLAELEQMALGSNPTLAEMVSAWQVAAARPAQVRSLDDPMFGAQFAPGAWFSRERAAVVEAKARVAQRLAERAKQIDQLNYQVQQAYEQVRESEQVVRLYEKTILPAARENVKVAQSAYLTGKIPFLSLIEAQRNVIGLRDCYYEALATTSAAAPPWSALPAGRSLRRRPGARSAPGERPLAAGLTRLHPDMLLQAGPGRSRPPSESSMATTVRSYRGLAIPPA